MIYRTLFVGTSASSFNEGALAIGAVEADTPEEAAVIATRGLKPYYKLLGIATNAVGGFNGHGSYVKGITLPEPVPTAVVGGNLLLSDLKG